MSTMTGGDILVEALAGEGIRRVFSIPGGQLLSIYDAIREHPLMDMIVPRHEGASALMACGYSIATGAPSVVMSTVGAGVIYEAGGLLFAWRERLPVLSIAPQVQSWKIKPIQESLQACDQDDIFKPFTKFRAIIYHYDRIPQLVRRAVKAATSPEPGPVHLDVPVDILFEYHRLSSARMKRLFPEGSFRFHGEVIPNDKALDDAARLVRSSRRPLALIGRGGRRFTDDALKNLLDTAALPVLHSTSSFGCVNSDYDKRLGDIKLWNGDEALEIVSKADLALVFEADEASARFTRKLKKRNPALKVVQSAELASSIGSVVPVEAALLGSVGAVLRELSTRVDALGIPEDRDDAWMSELAGLRSRLEAEHLHNLGEGPRLDAVLGTIDVVTQLLRPEDYVVCDGPLAAGAALVKLKHPGLHRAVLIDDDYIPGVGLPLALGLKAGAPESRVFLIAETGRIKRHAREFQSARRYGLAVTSFLFQEKDGKPEEEVDFATLATSLGVMARSITEPVEEITPDAVHDSFSSEVGVLFDASRF